MDNNKKTRLFFDMDGVLAEYRHDAVFEDIYNKDYFFTLRPNENIVEAAKIFMLNPLNLSYEVFVLSAVMGDRPLAKEEKIQWLDKYIPEIDEAHRIFTPCGFKKQNYIPGGVGKDDVLIDDFGDNCKAWENGKVIKVSMNIFDSMEEEKKWGDVIFPEQSTLGIMKTIERVSNKEKEEE